MAGLTTPIGLIKWHTLASSVVRFNKSKAPTGFKGAAYVKADNVLVPHVTILHTKQL